MRGRGRRISEFEASLVYKVSSGTARTIQRNPVSKKPKKPKNQKTKETVDLLTKNLREIQSLNKVTELEVGRAENCLTQCSLHNVTEERRELRCTAPASFSVGNTDNWN